MKMVISKKKDAESLLRMYCCGYFLIQTLHVTISNSMLGGKTWSLFYKILLLCVLFVGVIGLFKRRALLDFAIGEIFILFLFGLTYYRNNVIDLYGFDENIFYTCSTSIPYAFCIHEIKDKKLLLKYWYKTSIITHIIIYLGLFFYNNTGYSMGLGYSILPYLLIFLDEFFDKKKVINLVIAIIDVLYIVIFCSRGPIFAVAIYCLCRMIVSVDLPKNYKVTVSIFTLLACLVFYLYENSFFELMKKLLLSLGIRSRTLEMMINNVMISHDSGRKLIYETTKRTIMQKPLLGWGLGGGWVMGHPHNIILESLLSFGLIFGTVFILLFIVKWWKIIRTKDSHYQRIGFILGGEVMTMLFSGTIVKNYMLFAFMFL